ncbi:unnamed protein product [Ambrosiozyma monospora]|uniref:Unnamed protein product n=1 Tax=Ambrosiozyma monospora TaxID=43982 RepID=A0ACB5T492_AMBMO|nr:unnamed protein product [Ambrosiozyma monospora]
MVESDSEIDAISHNIPLKAVPTQDFPTDRLTTKMPSEEPAFPSPNDSFEALTSLNNQSTPTRGTSRMQSAVTSRIVTSPTKAPSVLSTSPLKNRLPTSPVRGRVSMSPTKAARRVSVIGLEPLQDPKRRRLSSDPQPQPEVHEPRLVIDHLLLHNFKSYAGDQIIGPFNASFSAVVGPNGSGKSNVIDSLLFVFGFRASKMRQSKLKSC